MWGAYLCINRCPEAFYSKLAFHSKPTFSHHLHHLSLPAGYMIPLGTLEHFNPQESHMKVVLKLYCHLFLILFVSASNYLIRERVLRERTVMESLSSEYKLSPYS